MASLRTLPPYNPLTNAVPSHHVPFGAPVSSNALGFGFGGTAANPLPSWGNGYGGPPVGHYHPYALPSRRSPGPSPLTSHLGRRRRSESPSPDPAELESQTKVSKKAKRQIRGLRETGVTSAGPETPAEGQAQEVDVGKVLSEYADRSHSVSGTSSPSSLSMQWL